MKSEKSRAVIVIFEHASQAERRIAGVAAAARIARDLADAGAERIWLGLPDGGRLSDKARADLDRIAGGVDVALIDAGEIPAIIQGPGIKPDVVEAPCLTHSDILKGTGKGDDGPVSRWLNRPISRQISAVLLQIPAMRPIHASAGTALLAALMFGAFMLGGMPGMIAGGILFQAASIFDGVDGEIARATFRTSSAGAILDSVIDTITNFLFILGVTINLGLSGNQHAVAVGGWGIFLFAAGLLVMVWRAARSDGTFNLDLIKHRLRRQFPGGMAAGLISFLTVVSSRDFFALLFLLLILAGLPMAVLYIFAAAATVWIFAVGALPLLAYNRGTTERSA